MKFDPLAPNPISRGVLQERLNLCDRKIRREYARIDLHYHSMRHSPAHRNDRCLLEIAQLTVNSKIKRSSCGGL